MQNKTGNNSDIIRVLLVDDDVTQTELAKLNLEFADPALKITAKLKPLEALELIKNQIFDCIVSDYVMPEMNGVQFCTEVRKTSMIPFIIYTGRGSEEVASASFAAGADDYVRKEASLAHYQVLGKRIRHAVEKKRAERELELSNQRLKEILESIQDSFWQVDYDWNFIYVSKNFADAASMKQEEMVGQSIWKLFPKHLGTPFETNLREAMEKREIRRFEIGGKYTPVWYSMTIYPSANGVSALGTDITEQKKIEDELKKANKELKSTEEELRASSEQVQEYANRLEHLVDARTKQLRESSNYARSLIEASIDPLVTISEEGKITDVNNATIKVTGVPREKLIGSDFSDYFTDPESARAGYRKVFEEGQVKDYPLTIKNVSGETTDVLYNATVYRNESGGVQGVFAVARDVTRRKKAEERLLEASNYTRSLIEASLDPLVTIDAEGKITDVNEATVQVTGATRDELIGSEFANYFTEPEKAREGRRIVFAEGYVKDYPLTIRNKSGKLTEVLYNATLYRRMDGEVVGIFAAARDVTEKNRLLEKLRRAEVIAAVEQIGATVAHDLRGPLGLIVQSMEMAKRNPSFTPRALQIAEESAVRALKMIADWRTNTREMVPQPVKTDLSALVNRVLKDSQLPQNVEATTFIGDGLNSVKLDPDIMHRVIENLVKNAVEAMPSGGRLTIKGNNVNEKLELIVSDTGVGIPAESREKIWTPLYTMKRGGMGLGLTYCRRAVEAQGGSIDFESEVGRGTTFTIKLPTQ